MSAASYTYAAARPFDPTQAAGLAGVDGAAIHLVRHQELVAVVSPLAPAHADGTALRARLETLAELEAIARAHHGVVAAVAACAVTLPFRLATDAGVLSFISTTTVFGTPVDVTLSELALESFFPADPATAATLRTLAQQ